MKCIYHNEREAEFVCSTCGQPTCRECITVINGKNVCKACSYRNTQQNIQLYNQAPYKKNDGVNGFLFFIFLAVPGLRHMYIGLMRRGLEFLVGFFGIFTLGILLGNPGVIVIPIAFMIWFYSAFDSYHSRKLIAKGEKVEDKPIFNDYGIDQIKDYFGHRKQLVGIVVIVFGVFLLFKQLRMYSFRFHIPAIILNTLDLAFDSIIPILLIAGGLYLMTRVGKGESIRNE